MNTPLNTQETTDDLTHIADGIRRMQTLFEMRCEDHAELARYATDAVTNPSEETLRALETVITIQQQKWKGMEHEPKEEKTKQRPQPWPFDDSPI